MRLISVRRESEKREREGKRERGKERVHGIEYVSWRNRERMRKTVRERRGREECCHVITGRPKTDKKWSVPWTKKKEMWIKRKHSLSFSLFLLLLPSLSLLPSFVLSLSSSLSLSNADVLHTLSHTNAPTFTCHHCIQRQEGEKLTSSWKEC